MDSHVGKPVRERRYSIVDFTPRRILPTGLASARKFHQILFPVQNGTFIAVLRMRPGILSKSYQQKLWYWPIFNCLFKNTNLVLFHATFSPSKNYPKRDKSWDSKIIHAIHWPYNPQHPFLSLYYINRRETGLRGIMVEILQNSYPWVKALHVISVIAWMAGLFYLPRLFVYHAEVVGQDGETHMLFMTMERRLLRAIMNPAMIAAWTFGLLMAATPDRIDWSQFWPWVKMFAVLGMTWFHIWCAKSRKAFETGENEKAGRHYRIMNEVPTLLLIIIVIMVIVQPA